MDASSPDESSQPASESGKDFEFVKPVGRPVRRKRPVDISELEGQPPSTSSRKENRESLDVFACVGVLYNTRQHKKKLKNMYNEFNSVTENGKDADFTVNVAKAMATKLNNGNLDTLIQEWEYFEDMWQKLVQKHMACCSYIKKASERYVSAVNCFLSVWEMKNEALEQLALRLERLLCAIKKTSDGSELKSSIKKANQAFYVEDEVSTQMVFQQDVLITLIWLLFKQTHEMDPYGKFRKEWGLLRVARNNVKNYMLRLDVNFEKEVELARETCGSDVSSNNTLKEVCMIMRRWMEEYNVLIQKTVKVFIDSSQYELKIDNLFTEYLTYRITMREKTPSATFDILRLLCHRGAGGSFPENMRTKYAGKEPVELKAILLKLQAQKNLWHRLEAVQFAEQNKVDCEYWVMLHTMVKEDRRAGKAKETTPPLQSKGPGIFNS